MKKFLPILLIIICIGQAVFSQQNQITPAQDELIDLRVLARQLHEARTRRLVLAVEQAQQEGKPLKQMGENGEITELQDITPSGELIYYITDNLDAARTVSTNKVWPGGGLGYSLTGGGVNIGEWDGGAVRATHRELITRVTQVDGAVSLSDHATHVAGTIIGAGVDTSAKGMAYTANLNANDWSFDDAEMASAAANGMLLSNHSYGTITGWRFNSDLSRWEWWGDTSVSAVEDYKFGFYSFDAQNWDLIARNAPYYLIVKSAGNDRGDSHSGLHYLNSSSGTSTATRDIDGGLDGYDCISTSGNAKNILTIGAVNAIPSGYSAPAGVMMSSFSGWGPTDDGRIKPDIVANGVGVYSSLATHDSAYASYNGTSMSAPNTTGSLALIQQHHFNEKSSYLLAATLKALVIHTADEAGPTEGPDYMFGWGLLNTAAAVEHISNVSSRDQILENTLSNNQTYDLVITSDGLSPLRATICWTDVPGNSPAISLNPTTSMLVNDLDLRIIETAIPTTHFPYVLNPTTPSAAATTSDNERDNVEQVYLANPSAGSYTIRVTHKGTLSSGSAQNFSLVVSGGVLTTTPRTCTVVLNAFPYQEDFESFNLCSSTPGASCNLPALSGWENSTSDSIDWTVFNGATPTSSTGPFMDLNPGTVNGKYLYVETSSVANPSKLAVLESPCFDLDVLTDAELSFAYHMNGTQMGSLSVDVNSGISWTNLWFSSGDQGTGWNTANIDLSAYEGDTIKLRFRALSGSGELSDIAIDDIRIRSNPLACFKTIGTFPYSEDFEGFINCNTTAGSSCNLLASSGWYNDLNDDIDWTTNNGPTTSGGTGPAFDFNPGSASGKYLYTEASAMGTGFPAMEAVLYSPCFDLTNMTNTELSFAYHQWGDSAGAIYLEVDDGFGWSEEWVSAGDQGDVWRQVQLDLSVYDGEYVQFRFRGVTGNDFTSDLAIDDIRVGDPTPRIYCSSGATFTDDTHIANVSLENINNSSILCASYSDFTALVADLKVDSTYSLSVTTGDCDGGAAYQRAVKAYIDWNNDGDFDDLGEEVLDGPIGPATSTVANFAVPSSTVADSIRMRVVCSEDNPILPCGTYNYGETEDYTLAISKRPANDDCENAIALQCGQPLYGSTDLATADAVGTCGTSISAPGVWYKVIGNGDKMTVSTCGQSSFDTKINVFSGPCNTLTCVGGNDDFCGITSELAWSSVSGQDYFVLVQGGAGETGQFQISLTSLLAANITVGGATTFCEGESVLLTSDSAAHYQWSLNSNPLLNDTLRTFSASVAGDYSLEIADNNACTGTTAVPTSVTVTPLPTVNITPDGATTFCTNDSVVLNASTGNTYQWYKEGVNIVGAVGPSYTATLAGTYNVVVEDANTCEDSAITGQSIVVNPLPSVSILASGPTALCIGDSVALSTVVGTVHQWYLNGSLIGGATNSSFFASNPGNYNVFVGDANSCEDSATIATTITINALPIVSITAGGATTFCADDSVTFSASSGTAYQWYKDGASIAGATSPTYTATLSGTYNAVVEDVNMCEDSATVGQVAAVNPLPLVSITPNGPTTFCADDSVTLNASSGTAYQWYKNGTTIAGATSSSYAATLSGNYNVIVEDLNTCEDSAVVGQVTTVNALPIVNISPSGPTTFCEGSSVSFSTSGGTSFQWYRNGTAVGGGTSSHVVTTSGSYNVRVTDANTCSDSALLPQVALVNPLPIVSIAVNGSSTLCEGDSVNLTTATGMHYSWMLNGLNLLNDTLANLWVSTAGTYNVLLTNGSQCSDTAATGITIVVDPLPVIAVGAIDPLCNTITSVTLSAGSPVGGVYTGIAVSQDSIFDPSMAGTGNHVLYYHYVDPVTGCEDSAAVDVEVGGLCWDR
jgi:hypothetical protein